MADTREDRMKRRQVRQQEQERKEQERRAAEEREGAEAVERIRQRLIQMQLRDQGVDLTDEEDRNEFKIENTSLMSLLHAQSKRKLRKICT